MITWRARYCLNLQNLPYQMVYVEIPDVETLAKNGATPTGHRPDGAAPKYTIPIIQDHSTGGLVSNSPAIAAYLDPSSGPVLARLPFGFAFTDAVDEAFEHLRVPLFYADMVVKMNDRTASCMRETLAGMYT